MQVTRKNPTAARSRLVTCVGYWWPLSRMSHVQQVHKRQKEKSLSSQKKKKPPTTFCIYRFHAILHYFPQITGNKWLSVSPQTLLLHYDFILPWWKSLSDWSSTQAVSVLWTGLSWIYYREPWIIHHICVYSYEYSWWNYTAGRRVGL